MMNKNSSLIWLAVGSGILLCFVVLFGNPVYGEYRQENGKLPLPAVVFAAMQDSVYPWSVPLSEGEGSSLDDIDPEEASDPGYVKEKETTAADGETVRETEVPQGPGLVLPEETTSETQAETPAETSAQETTAAENAAFHTAGVYYFADACFIGDSFTEGLYCYAKIPKTDYYACQGLNTYSILKHKFRLPDGGEGTLEQALAQKQYGKIYIMLGINELGNTSPEAFAAHYNEMIGRIRALQPDAVIFIQSIFHTTQKKSASSQFKNSLINADNEALKTLADNKTVFYLDINSLFDDETGALRADYSGDGVHIKASHYVTWRDYLLQHAVFRNSSGRPDN